VRMVAAQFPEGETVHQIWGAGVGRRVTTTA
jgi:hypothetical protein